MKVYSNFGVKTRKYLPQSGIFLENDMQDYCLEYKIKEGNYVLFRWKHIANSFRGINWLREKKEEK